MQRPGTNPDDVQMADILCDFCRREWTEALAMVEGHRGSVICGECLSLAFDAIGRTEAAGEQAADGRGADASEAPTCRMCLESKREKMWPGPMDASALACRRCIRQSAGMLEKDAESGWRRPD
jgi:ClpX C4-type zinc finger